MELEARELPQREEQAGRAGSDRRAPPRPVAARAPASRAGRASVPQPQVMRRAALIAVLTIVLKN